MLDLIYFKLTDPQFLLTVAMPLIESDTLSQCMKSLATERERIRARERLIADKSKLSRRSAYENLGLRTGIDSVRQITTVLIQAERYGTPLGTALRIVAQESRDHRMMLAEKKAAALPPKLTVPMILFFLPLLFAVILTPAIIQLNHTGS